MNDNADPYTNVIPGFIPTAQLTREWAEKHLGARLESFARQVADHFAKQDAEIDARPVTKEDAA